MIKNEYVGGKYLGIQEEIITAKERNTLTWHWKVPSLHNFFLLFYFSINLKGKLWKEDEF